MFGYEIIVYIIGELVKIVVMFNIVVYDFGCSLGVVSLFVVRVVFNDICEIIGVDVLEVMVECCKCVV